LLFSDLNISEGSIATSLRCGWINNHFIANLLVNLPVQEYWKSVNIWWSYRLVS